MRSRAASNSANSTGSVVMPLKFAFIVPANVAQRGKQNFVHRSVVACQVDDKRPADAGGDSFVREELHHVEQIREGAAGPLRSGQLAGRTCPPVTRPGISRSAMRVSRAMAVSEGRANRIDGAPHHEVDFDLDLDGRRAAPAALSRRHLAAATACVWKPRLAEAFGGLPNCVVDALKRLIA